MGNEASTAADSGAEGQKARGEPVILNVYDLIGGPPSAADDADDAGGAAGAAASGAGPDGRRSLPFGLGAYHSGVVAFGSEWSFGGGGGSGTGVWSMPPKSAPNARFKESIVIGETKLNYKQFQALIEKMKKEYPQSSYHLTARNCNHFADDLCKRLTGKGIPAWVNRAATIGNMFAGLVPGLAPVPPAVDAAGPAETPAFSGSGFTLSGKKVDSKTSAKLKGPKDEPAEVRRQKMLEATMKRMSAVTAAPATASTAAAATAAADGQAHP